MTKIKALATLLAVAGPTQEVAFPLPVHGTTRNAFYEDFLKTSGLTGKIKKGHLILNMSEHYVISALKKLGWRENEKELVWMKGGQWPLYYVIRNGEVRLNLLGSTVIPHTKLVAAIKKLIPDFQLVGAPPDEETADTYYIDFTSSEVDTGAVAKSLFKQVFGVTHEREYDGGVDGKYSEYDVAARDAGSVRVRYAFADRKGVIRIGPY